MKNNCIKNQGFGLLEAILAVGVLIIAVGSTAFLNRLIVRNSVLSLDRTQAYNLAQQGIEGVRAIRDTNWLNKRSWNEGMTLSRSESDSEAYDVMQTNDNWMLSSNYPAKPIIINNIDFKRKIFILDDNPMNNELKTRSNNEINNANGEQFVKIKVVVEWESYGQTWKIETTEYIGDWKPTF